MTRKELANEAYTTIRKELGNEKSEKEIWKAIAETSDDELYNFCVFREEIKI